MSINFDQRYIDFNLARDYPPAPPEEQPDEMPMMEDVQLAAGPSGTVSDAGAAFGVFPQMKPRRGGRSDIGERVITGAPDFAAGAARGATTAALGIGGDIQKIGRFITALATDNQGGSITDRLGRAAQTMENPTLLPSSEDVSKGGYTIPGTSITLPGLPPAVPAGQAGFGMTPEQRQSAAEAGQFAGEMVGDPLIFAKGGQLAAKAIQSTKGMPVGMSTQAIGGMEGVLKPANAAAPVSDIGFYSAVEQTAMNLPRKSGTGQAFLNDITKGENVKADEIKWIGLDDFLKGKKNVTREEVQQYIAANKVDVQEITLGGADNTFTDPQKAIAYVAEREGMTPSQVIDNWGYTNQRDYLTLANDMAQLDPVDGSLPAKFGQYTIPGGQNYREILLTLPSKEPSPTQEITNLFNERGELVAQRVGPPSERMQQTLAANPGYRIEAATMEGNRQGDFTSSHWEQKNVLAHIRVNDRVDADGKKMLLIEEVQSDWHQTGRDKGYKNDAALENRFSELTQQHREIVNRRADIVATPGMEQEYSALARQEQQLIDEMNKLHDTKQYGVPDAPMKDTWYQLALKRVLKYAADNGYERVGLTTGSRQAERFDLSKQVDEIAVPMVNADGGRSVRIDPTEGTSIKLMVDKDGVVTGYGSGSTQFSGKKLNEVIGKEMADKVMKAEADSKFSGLDLQVGGEGMKKYYDEVYPKFLEKYGKKWGAKVGETSIEIDRTRDSSGTPSIYPGKERLRYVDITPEMRQSVGKGQPLFTATGAGTAAGATMSDKEQN